MRDSLVLGAGPVGLLTAYMNSSPCVGEVLGGSSLRRLAPTFLWRTDATAALLAEVGIPFRRTVARIGYLGDDGVSDVFDEDGRVEYYRRSRGFDPDAPVVLPGSVMSSGSVGEIPTFDVSVDDLVATLSTQVEVRRGRVTSIRIADRESGRVKVPKVFVSTAEGMTYVPEVLLNTIPAPAFDVALEYVGSNYRPVRRDWDAGRKTFVVVPVDALPAGVPDATEFVFVYVVASDRARYPFDRINFVTDDLGRRTAVLEYNGVEPPKLPGEMKRISGKFQIRGVSRDPIEFGGVVRHVGRFARWDHAVRLHDVVEDFYE